MCTESRTDTLLSEAIVDTNKLADMLLQRSIDLAEVQEILINIETRIAHLFLVRSIHEETEEKKVVYLHPIAS